MTIVTFVAQKDWFCILKEKEMKLEIFESDYNTGPSINF